MYGPNSHWQGYRGELIPRMITRAMNRKPLVIFGNGRQTRDFVYVEDAARAVIAIAENNSCLNKCINFCSGTETSVRKIAEMICECFDINPEEFIENRAPRPGDVMRHLGSSKMCQKLIGLIPDVNIKDGIRQTCEWFKSLPYTAEELISQERIINWE
jgi:UDP-glucose 4-epimerase